MQSGDDVRSDRGNGSSIPVEEIEPSEGMYRCFLAGDCAGALKLAEDILATRPDDGLAASVIAQCRPPDGFRAGMEMDEVPEVLAPPARVSSLDLDLRAVFLLTCIDGSSTVEQIVDRAGIARADALRVLENLASAGVIRLRKT